MVQIFYLLLITLFIPVFTAADTDVNTQETDVINFEPILSSANTGSLPARTPFVIPAGFEQLVISDEASVNPLNIYKDISDWPDMITLNETNKFAGRYLYRTHEVRNSLFSGNQGLAEAGGGAVSVIDLTTGQAKVLVQRRDWEALDGIVWTPWGTILVSEEIISRKRPDPDFPEAKSGLAYEIKLNTNNPDTVDSVKARPMLGSLAHEGIETDEKGNVYVIDETINGSIYKFVPEKYGDLGKGQLYALKVDDQENNNRTGPAQWLALDMMQAQISARIAAADVHATTYHRPEDLERIDNSLYVAITGEKRVLTVTLEGKPHVSEFVKAGKNVSEETFGQSGFNKPDNLANDPTGNLWIVEDNNPSDIWVASTDTNGDGYADSVRLFASLSTPGAEATGIYFRQEPAALFINIQHAHDGNDKTMMINRLTP